jgi:hypothetical protein
MVNIAALHLFHRDQFSRIVTANEEVGFTVRADFVRQVFDHNALVAGQGDGAFDGIA